MFARFLRTATSTPLQPLPLVTDHYSPATPRCHLFSPAGNWVCSRAFSRTANSTAVHPLATILLPLAAASSCRRRRNWVCSRAFREPRGQPRCIHSPLTTVLRPLPVSNASRQRGIGFVRALFRDLRAQPLCIHWRRFSGHSPLPPFVAGAKLGLFARFSRTARSTALHPLTTGHYSLATRHPPPTSILAVRRGQRGQVVREPSPAD